MTVQELIDKLNELPKWERNTPVRTHNGYEVDDAKLENSGEWFDGNYLGVFTLKIS